MRIKELDGMNYLIINYFHRISKHLKINKIIIKIFKVTRNVKIINKNLLLIIIELFKFV